MGPLRVWGGPFWFGDIGLLQGAARHPLSVTPQACHLPRGGRLETGGLLEVRWELGAPLRRGGAAPAPLKGSLGMGVLSTAWWELGGSPLSQGGALTAPPEGEPRGVRGGFEGAVKARAAPLRHASRATSPVGRGLERADFWGAVGSWRSPLSQPLG